MHRRRKDRRLRHSGDVIVFGDGLLRMDAIVFDRSLAGCAGTYVVQ